MVAAKDNDADCATTAGLLASFGYDPQSRRTSVSYAGGAAMNTPSATAYSPAGDLLSLQNVFPGSTTSNNTFSYSYTAAHQTLTADNGRPSWFWQPRANTSTAYGPGNRLNQYPAVAGIAQSYDLDGNLTFDGTTTFA